MLIERLQRGGTLDVLGWTPAAVQLRRRLDLAYRRLGPPWQPRDPEGLLGSLSDWLGDALEGCQSWRDLDATTLENALWGSLEWSHRQELERLLPRRLSIPSGRFAELTYEEDGQVVLAVKLQEMFGCETGPTVLQGELPVTVELLSPAGDPRRERVISRVSGMAAMPVFARRCGGDTRNIHGRRSPGQPGQRRAQNAKLATKKPESMITGAGVRNHRQQISNLCYI